MNLVYEPIPPKDPNRNLGAILQAYDRSVPPIEEGMARLAAARQITFRPGQVLWRYWHDSIWWGNQGSTSACVGYAWTKFLMDGPITQPWHAPNPYGIYRRGQQIDPWNGGEARQDDGTTVDAVGRILVQDGLVQSFYLADNLQSARDAILTVGPIVMASPWFSNWGWSQDVKDGLLKWEGRGAYIGGHATLLNGYNKLTKRWRGANSWGPEFGVNGRFYIQDSVMEHLFSSGWLDLALAIETRPSRPKA